MSSKYNQEEKAAWLLTKYGCFLAIVKIKFALCEIKHWKIRRLLHGEQQP